MDPDAARETIDYLLDAKKQWSHIHFDMLKPLEQADLWNTVDSLEPSMSSITNFLSEDIGAMEIATKLLGRQTISNDYIDIIMFINILKTQYD